jgi:elongator complex protein 1
MLSRLPQLTHTAYTLASKIPKALKAYEKAHAWRELFAFAIRQNLPKEELSEMAERVTGQLSRAYRRPHLANPADHLSSRGRSLEAAQVFLDYQNDVDSAVDVLCRGAEFAEAYRLVSFVSVHFCFVLDRRW